MESNQTNNKGRGGDEETCEKSPNGEHLPSLTFAQPATGFTDHEGGVVVEFECRYCGRPGACLVLFEEVLW
jgi:hypothetical protein